MSATDLMAMPPPDMAPVRTGRARSHGQLPVSAVPSHGSVTLDFTRALTALRRHTPSLF